jgi:glycosyltransferase involved in cell wall biosynthesis
MAPAQPRTLLYLVTEDFYFASHRLPVARAARDAGMRVVVATRVGSASQRLRDEGFEVVPLRHLRRGMAGPHEDLRLVAELVAVYRRWRPDLVHHVAAKPVLYGSLAATLAGVPRRVNAFAGLGWAYTQPGARGAVLARAFSAAYRVVLGAPRSVVLFQNGDDRDTLVRTGAVRADRTVVIRGSGVDLEVFRPRSAQDGAAPEAGGASQSVVIALGARMLRDKGIHELVDAMRLLRARGLAVEARLHGAPDPENPASIEEAVLEGWNREGIVRWTGPTRDMAGALREADIACLPSYREGLPKFLLEAAATGLPLVSCDVPGCREIVQHGENGLLVPARRAEPLAEALAQLVTDVPLRIRMGTASRHLAETSFGEREIARQTLELYERLLA